MRFYSVKELIELTLAATGNNYDEVDLDEVIPRKAD